MRAWMVGEFGPFRQVLRLQERPLPASAPRPGDGPGGASVPSRSPDRAAGALVRVEAADVNFPDLLLIAGAYQLRPELPFTPGFAAAGRVEQADPDHTLAVGDRVVCPLLYGGFQEYLRVQARDAFPIPAAMSAAVAVAFFLSFQTAWFALVRQARLRPGEVLLVHGGAGGVGAAAIQLGKVLGAEVVATARGEDKCAASRLLGADHALDSATQDFVAAVRQITGGRGADVVFDPVGGDLFERSTKCIAWEGRILPIGFASGTIPSIGANRILFKNIAVVGMYWTSYWQHAPEDVRRVHSELVELHGQGRIAPLIHREYPFELLPRALAAVERREIRGKAVLTMNGEGT